MRMPSSPEGIAVEREASTVESSTNSASSMDSAGQFHKESEWSAQFLLRRAGEENQLLAERHGRIPNVGIM